MCAQLQYEALTDGIAKSVTASAQKMGIKAEHWNHDNSAKTVKRSASERDSYYRIANHYGWALRRVFDHADKFKEVIILEEDLEISPDFFDYMAACSGVVEVGCI